MNHLSMVQALDIWSDLESAYYGQNKYGGNVAEIYMFRLGLSMSSLVHRKVSKEQIALAAELACESLFNLLQHFQDNKGGRKHVRIKVDSRPLGAWVKKAEFTHRVHVTVERIGIEL